MLLLLLHGRLTVLALGSAVPARSCLPAACLGIKLQQVKSERERERVKSRASDTLFSFLGFVLLHFLAKAAAAQQLTLSSNMRFMRQFVKRKWLLPRIIIVHHGGRNAIQSRQQGKVATSRKWRVKVKCLLESIRLHFCLYYVYAASAKECAINTKQIEFLSLLRLGFAFIYIF